MDPATFKKLFLPFHPKLYRIAYRMVQSQEDAEDILQDTYTKLWEKRKQLPDILNYESFAVRVLKNTCLDFLKKNKLYSLQVEEVEVADLTSFSRQLENENVLEHLRRLVEYLPAQHQKVFQLHYRDEFSLEEIEDITGLSNGNIKVILSRARKMIKDLGIKYKIV